MRKILEDMKNEYESVRPSDGFRERVFDKMKKKRKKRVWVRAAASLAAVFVLFIVSLNAIPTLADELGRLPGMQGVVRVLTFGRYQVEDNNFYANIVTPKIEGLLDQELQDRLNADLKENADAAIAAFEKDYKQLKQEMPDAHLGMECNYMIKTDTDRIQALDVYWLTTVGSSSTKHTFYTIDKQTGSLLTLPSLFQDGVDYQTPISDYLLGEMKRLNEAAGYDIYWVAEDGFAEPFTKIAPDQNFYLDDQGRLVICFDKYEVGPGSTGSPEFVIPDEVIQTLLR